jgi:hypothetical protein
MRETPYYREGCYTELVLSAAAPLVEWAEEWLLP